MDQVYRGFETSLLGLALYLGVTACLMLGTEQAPRGIASVTLPMLSVAAPAP